MNGLIGTDGFCSYGERELSSKENKQKSNDLKEITDTADATDHIRGKMPKIEFGPAFLFVVEPPFTWDKLLGSVGMERKPEDVKEKKEDA